ncbi:DNA-binding transcriptional MerR regulator [Litorivivens lipolytica]|uniref:DNA-binding transcriptional MerR regulator n=1 Tax=Litorivivens lipolytica TaxID=1524264 RepID=A0A7W4W401_9GAMM|nr:DNA-binding transcriptional MerR regulator [Litorivivens lipolytica]
MSATSTKSRTYSISQLAEEFAITTRTIRFYEEKGLLQPKRNGQTRIYSAADRVKLILILRGKRLGLSLEESKDIIEMYHPDQDNSHQLQTLIDKIREKREQLKTQLDDLRTMMRELDEAEARCADALTVMKNVTTSS